MGILLDLEEESWRVYGGRVLTILKKRLVFQWTPSRDVVDSLFEQKPNILGCTSNWQGKADEGIEERMQSANKAWWKDVKTYRSKDVPWRVKCRRMAEHVYSVFCSGSEKWSWTQKTLKQNLKMRNKVDESSISLQKRQR